LQLSALSTSDPPAPLESNSIVPLLPPVPITNSES
jgi:hypothetical protein